MISHERQPFGGVIINSHLSQCKGLLAWQAYLPIAAAMSWLQTPTGSPSIDGEPSLLVTSTTSARAGLSGLAFLPVIFWAKAGNTQLWPSRYVPTPAPQV